MVIDMRFILFFLFLFLYSYQVFALDSPDGGTICYVAREGNAIFTSDCSDLASSFKGDPSVTNLVNEPYSAPLRCNYKGYSCVNPCPSPGVYDQLSKSCLICPAGMKANTIINAGVSSTSCIPDVPGEGEECDGEAKVYDPVSESMVCPGSGDGSSASSAQSSPMCVVPGDFNGDCIADEEQGSSAGNSSAAASTPPTSSPDTGSSGSGGGGGGDDGGDDGGGPSNGGGSASSSASAGSNSSHTPNSGYGNWIPVNANSNCPNKYQDASGQWWCSGSNSPQQGSAASTAAGTCDPTATDYWACINSASNASAGSAGSASSDDSENELVDKGHELIEGLEQDIDEQMDGYEQAYADDIDAFAHDGVPFADEPSFIKSVLVSFLPVSTACDPPTLIIFNEHYEVECTYFNIFKQALGWFLAIVTAFQIWQMAIRPVER
jgi:hypothetical protein